MAKNNTTAQQAYEKGYEAGQKAYAKRPDLETKREMLGYASVDLATSGIPTSKYGDYQRGFFAGYEDAKKGVVR